MDPSLLYGNLPIVLGVFLIAFLSTRKRLNQNFLSLILLSLACILIVGSICSGSSAQRWSTELPILSGIFPLTFLSDGLSSLFLLILAVVSVGIALLSPGYLSHRQDRLHAGHYWSATFIFVLSMCAVILSADAITFLVFWELMSITSCVLVATDHHQHSVQKSALIYLGATRIATALLSAGFLWMHAISGSWCFESWHFNAANSYGAAVLILIGFCIKSGIWPFHIWLPYAYPAAPAPVSVLMSGAMINIPLYGIIRILLCGDLNSSEIATFALLLGSISAFWGILFALVQNDIKRLLAYSSVENVGLILMAISLAIKARIANLPDICLMALTAATFHCLNHGVFKALLFSSAGIIDTQAHTRDLRHLGGLVRAMPYTTACFLVGALAACCLPPLNGFASKWLLFQSLFRSIWESHSLLDRGTCIAAICLLSIVSGLTLASFTKVTAVCFLGKSRSNRSENAKECRAGMLAAQIYFATICVVLGVSAPYVTHSLSRVLADTLHLNFSQAPTTAINTPLMALLLCALFSLIYISFSSRSPVRSYSTWDCGFGPLSARSQVTSDSFAQPLARIFSPFLQYQTEIELSGKDRRHFPETINAKTRMVSLLESRVYLPALTIISHLAKMLARFQAGSIHIYLLYVCITLVLLLLLSAKL
jgi:formate hydrogenlyase subunit 3/multisubunit Na+/H+ antiporter MnhD subunit